MTEQEFAGLKLGDVVAARPGDRYVVTEVRSDGVIAVKTTELRDTTGWFMSRSRQGGDPLKERGLSGLVAGDMITQEHGLTHIVASNEGGVSVTLVISVKLWRPTDWALVSK